MRNLSSELQSHLASGDTTLCHCWRVTRIDGIRLGFTDHDRALAFEGTDFSPNSGFDGTTMESTADLAPDNSEIEGILYHDGLAKDDILAGRYDGAEIEAWRVNWREPAQRVLIKTGVIGEVRHSAHGFTAEVRGLSHYLDQTVGRLYQRQCDANVGDPRCGVDLDNSAFKSTGSVVEVTGENAFFVSGLAAFTDDWFVEGQLIWTLGRNSWASGFVKAFTTAADRQAISLWQPAALSINPGDEFTVTAGCDRRFETCRAKFNNAINFRGFHLMPGNDFIISYPLRRENNDGGSR